MCPNIFLRNNYLLNKLKKKKNEIAIKYEY